MIHQTPSSAKTRSRTTNKKSARTAPVARTEAIIPALTTRSIAALREAAKGCRACPFTVAEAVDSDVLVTVHPSFLLRVPDEDRDAAFAQFVDDLTLASKYAPASE